MPHIYNPKFLIGIVEIAKAYPYAWPQERLVQCFPRNRIHNSKGKFNKQLISKIEMNTKDLNSYKVFLGQDQKHEVLSLNLTKWLADIRTSIL